MTVYKYIELVGVSNKGFAEAVEAAVMEASKTVRHIGWVEVEKLSCKVNDGRIAEYQAAVKIGFEVER